MIGWSRYLQFGEVMRHVALRRASVGDMPLVLGGDLNTLVSGITRALPLLFDPMTIATLFSGFTSEASLWKQWLSHQGGGGTSMPTSIQLSLLLMGVNPARAARAEQAADPVLRDPFHPDADTTVSEIGGRWTAKLDWLLLSNLRCIAHALGGGDASDHQWLCVDCAV